ncbi:hypothetical protein [Subtercola boreus]|uniref:hypothetical protein n=1 Tax=Subtercola boreus TaxID=120213 RepID=UPI00209BD0DC|nr:hypothetical protein [Subtercola boreus]
MTPLETPDTELAQQTTKAPWLRSQLGTNLLDDAVITTGKVAYRRTDGIAVIPLALLGV